MTSAPPRSPALPPHALFIAEYAREHGIDLVGGPLRAGFFGAEPWCEEMRADIETKLGIKAYDIYGLTELIGPGVAAECGEQDGLHVFEDHFYPEIIDSESGARAAGGGEGRAGADHPSPGRALRCSGTAPATSPT